MKIFKTKSRKGKRKYNKPISLYPLKPEEALAAFMKVDPKKILKQKGKSNEKE
jgi:hypothetical protein